MKKLNLNKNNAMLLMVTVLFVSLILNVYSAVMNNKYKDIFGKEAYKRVEEIRHRNESVLTILDNSLKANSISHEELLVLYKSYNSISDALVDLISDYGVEKQSEFISSNSRQLSNQSNNNDVYFRIENLVFEYLNMEMKNGNQKLVLDKEILGNFEVMNSLAKDINVFYSEFNNNYLKDLDSEKKEDKVIKNDYWIDMMEGINAIVQRYVNYGFIIEKQ